MSHLITNIINYYFNSSNKMNERLYRFKPFCFEKVKYQEGTKVPKARSGHRIVCTDSNVYSFGGYNPNIDDNDEDMRTDSEWLDTKPLFREFWRFSFISDEWTRLAICESTPRELASHCAKLIDDKYLIIFGGTGFPFGLTSSNQLFVLNLNTNEWNLIECNNSDENECPIKQYGQALAIDHSNDLYIIGGTTGYDYTIDVHKFDLKTRLWHHLYKKPTYYYNEFPQERYRHEIVFYDNKLFVLGGGTSFQCYSLATIPVFNILTKEWVEIQTKNDINVLSNDSDGYPSPRRCHDCVQVEYNVFILGGNNGHKIFKDFWKLDLTSLQWTKMSVSLPKALYFHSAAVSSTGRLSVFGGVTHPNHNERTNDMFIAWIKIPSLKVMAFEALLFYIKGNTNKSTKEILLNLELPQNLIQNF